MQNTPNKSGPVLRLFQVQAKPGCAATLIKNFATTSVGVVQGQPGNAGYFFGQGTEADADYVVFASIWDDLDAVKTRFGKDWQSAFLPEGYESLIESCSVRHVDIGAGWHVAITP